MLTKTLSQNECNIRFEPAARGDVREIARFSEAVDLAQGAFVRPLDDYYSGMNALFDEPQHGTFYFIKDDARTVGMFLHRKDFRPGKGRVVFIVERIFIIPEYRGRRIPGVLFEFIEQLALDDGTVEEIELICLADNERALRCYAANGFVSNVHRMIRKVNRPESPEVLGRS